MTPLETLVATPLAAAVGWTLLHSLWEGAIIAAVLAAALVAMRSPRVRYAAACVAMLAMLAAFGLTLACVLPNSFDGLRTAERQAVPAWSLRAVMNAPAPSDLGLAALVPWLAPFWIVGVWMFYLGQAAGWASLWRLRRRGVCCPSEYWQAELARLGARLRLSRPVVMLESCLTDAPIVLGHFRPVILMPIGLLTGMPARQMEAILLHELAHVRRYDYLVNAVQRLLEGLLFYHPAVWWVSRVIRTERENCCDDVVVAMSGSAHEYAAALAALEQNRYSGREPAVAATGGSLLKRIRRLLDPQAPNGLGAPLLPAVILMATAACALAAWEAYPLQPNPATALPQSGRAETSPYRKWLNEDVLYIVTDEERAAFQRLTKDEEREKFIEQFWRRRDPNPGTPANEFKEEHYRRIAFANQRYGTSARAGWLTDRGHIYIVYGSPDEMEVDRRRTPFFEIWRYRHLEGIGENASIMFVDRAGTNDYRLVPGAWR